MVVGQWADTATNESWSAAYCSWSSGDSVSIYFIRAPAFSECRANTVYRADGAMVTEHFNTANEM